MSFSCTIKQGKKDLTKLNGGVISCGLFDLAPNTADATEAPYRLSDLRQVVANCGYGAKLKEAAQDAFRVLQSMVYDNLESLKPCHCDTCTCEEVAPEGWSKKACQDFLQIDPKAITYLDGGW